MYSKYTIKWVLRAGLLYSIGHLFLANFWAWDGIFVTGLDLCDFYFNKIVFRGFRNEPAWNAERRVLKKSSAIKWWHWGVGVGCSSPPSPPWASPEGTPAETGSKAHPRPDLIARSHPQLLVSYCHEALFALAVWLTHTWKATTANRSFLFSSAVRLLSYCSVTPHVWCSYPPFLCPSQQGGQPGLLSERGQALSAFSVCGGGWEGSFLRVLCLGKEQTALQQEPPLATPLPCLLHPANHFLLLHPPLTWTCSANLEKLEPPCSFRRMCLSQMGADKFVSENSLWASQDHQLCQLTPVHPSLQNWESPTLH